MNRVPVRTIGIVALAFVLVLGVVLLKDYWLYIDLGLFRNQGEWNRGK